MVTVFSILVGRVGDALLVEGVGGFTLDGVALGVTLVVLVNMDELVFVAVR